MPGLDLQLRILTVRDHSPAGTQKFFQNGRTEYPVRVTGNLLFRDSTALPVNRPTQRLQRTKRIHRMGSVYDDVWPAALRVNLCIGRVRNEKQTCDERTGKNYLLTNRHVNYLHPMAVPRKRDSRGHRFNVDEESSASGAVNRSSSEFVILTAGRRRALSGDRALSGYAISEWVERESAVSSVLVLAKIEAY